MTHSPADLLTPAAVNALLLLAFRLGGMLLVAPMFSSRTVPVMVRTSLLIVLTWFLAPVAVGAAGAGAPSLTPLNALTETMVGFAIGLGAAVLLAGAEAAGEILSLSIGLSGAAALDPVSHASLPVMGQFTNLFALTLLLSLDGHIGMLDALAATLRFLPVGAVVEGADGLIAMVALGSRLFLLGLQFAAPVVMVVMLANLALGVLSRAAPQMNILAVAFPVQIGLGLIALFASLPLIATFFTGWDRVYDEVISQVLFALSGGRR
ncbi:MAG TPA: flagellar biosynthetic protein FliR [Longimicrobiaceae bacterium]